MPDKSIESIYPLSPMQQGMLFHTLLAPESRVYFNQVLYTLTGSLQVPALRLAWQQTMDRHAALRTLFVWEGQEKPLQVVRRCVELSWQEFDWRGLSSDEESQKMAEFLQADRRQGFDLSKAPVMRVALIRMDENRYELIWSHHHVLLDGWSSFLILKDVMAIYRALKEGQSCQLEPVRPYRDYVHWLQGQDFSKAEGLWRTALQGFTAPTQLLGDRLDESHPNQDYDVATQFGNSSSSLMAGLTSFGRRHDLTLGTLVHAAWAMLLSRYSGEQDIVFGSTVSGRSAELAGIESMVGLFINTLPVRARFSAGDVVVKWLKDFQSQLVELRQCEHSPLVDVQGWSEMRRGQPLFGSLLAFESYPVDTSVWGQEGFLQISNMRVVGPTNYPLGIVIVPRTELALKASYDPRRFEAAAISRMLGHFQTLLQGMVENPNQRIEQLPILTEAEKGELTATWNATASDDRESRCAYEIFEARVDEAPDVVAIIFGEQYLTYRELNARANQLARFLQQGGVGPETLVGLYFGRGVEMIVGLLAVWKAGGAYLPLDPAYPAERLAFMMEDAQVRLILSLETFATQLANCGAQIVCLDSRQEAIGRQQRENLSSAAKPDHLAYVIYTSGSTGKPKGAELLHRGLSNVISESRRCLGTHRGSRVLQFSSYSFDASLWDIVTALCAGATLCLASREELLPGPQLVEKLLQLKITHLTIPPSSLAVLPYQNLPALEVLCVAGEVCQAELVSRWGCGRRMLNLYGPTEGTIWSTWHECLPEGGTPPIGRPIANVRAYVLDREQQPVPVGVPGELYIGGLGVARGYLRRSELTAARFLANPIPGAPDSKLYRTGDLVRYRSDGNLEYLGRTDDQVKVRGFRIELGEIESALAAHPQVAQAVVVVWEDRPDDKRLVAYVVLRPQATSLSDADLHRHVRKKLPEHMVPAAIVVLDALPLTPNGKVDRKALPAPMFRTASPAVTPSAPPGAIEEELAGIFGTVLGVEKVGVQDNFFAIGGHSLLAAKLISQIRKRLHIDLPMRSLFVAPTPAGIAPLVLQQLRSQARTAAKESENSSGAPTAATDSTPPPTRPAHRDFAETRIRAPAGRGSEFLEVVCAGGNGTPLVCVGHAQPIPLLLKQMPSLGPVIHLKLDGCHTWPPRNLTLEQQISVYARDLEKHVPRRHALLVGYSYGGLLAYCLASRLLSKGLVDVDVMLIEPGIPYRNLPMKFRVRRALGRLYRRAKGFTRFVQAPRSPISFESSDGETRWNIMQPLYRRNVDSAWLSPLGRRVALVSGRQYHARYSTCWRRIETGGVEACVLPETDDHRSSFQEPGLSCWLDFFEDWYCRKNLPKSPEPVTHGVLANAP